ncbi:hypothetical protein BU17DRAFT_70064 [Hysterangium stoloniferum]|nr:hypothetical protein BU17DRAFT_70064 [Hysterangium stoloniferum]
MNKSQFYPLPPPPSALMPCPSLQRASTGCNLGKKAEGSFLQVTITIVHITTVLKSPNADHKPTSMHVEMHATFIAIGMSPAFKQQSKTKSSTAVFSSDNHGQAGRGLVEIRELTVLVYMWLELQNTGWGTRGLVGDVLNGVESGKFDVVKVNDARGRYHNETQADGRLFAGMRHFIRILHEL